MILVGEGGAVGLPDPDGLEHRVVVGLGGLGGRAGAGGGGGDNFCW
jgi:hypothetical protein